MEWPKHVYLIIVPARLAMDGFHGVHRQQGPQRHLELALGAIATELREGATLAEASA